ncbi:hypothetical protein WJX84_011013 [Apatococcus fuscideae]|uniref:Ubiquinol oxidase n=1 Tax=Apatococcus fuscideae TaxID=2026836 RepID=A0AAW1TC07_9CHLO
MIGQTFHTQSMPVLLPSISSSTPLRATRSRDSPRPLKRTRLHAAAQKTIEGAEKTAEKSASKVSQRTAKSGSPAPSKTGSDADGNDVCDVVFGSNGDVTQVMCCDYGFRSGFGRLYQDQFGEIPKNFFSLGWENFKREFTQLRKSFRYNEFRNIQNSKPNNPLSQGSTWLGGKLVSGLASIDEGLENANILGALSPGEEGSEMVDAQTGEIANDYSDVRERLNALKLDDAKVWAREHQRSLGEQAVTSPWWIKGAYLALCYGLDLIYANRPIQRFWLLETVARMPYFSYISMLHLYESLGWWRAGAELRKVHFAEEWNELHHLQIMESLGGDTLWIDRFLAQHAAVFYFWVIVLFFVLSPSLAYNFSELVEGHATDTYAEFVDENEEALKKLPPPLVALEYYTRGDLYMFDSFQTSAKARSEPRRPSCKTLYDVFCNVRDDEAEHVKTMKACQDYSIVDEMTQRREEKRPKPVGSPEAGKAT